MKHYFRKSDIDTHSQSYYGKEYPAINVKCYSRFGGNITAEELHCDETTLEKALEYAWDSSTSQFWDCVQDTVEYYFPKYSVKVYSAGRSSGWVTVEGLPEIESWDAILVSAWGRLENSIKKEIAYLCSKEKVTVDITANRWNEAGAEMYNFVGRKDGNNMCIVDLKNAAIQAGFAPVIR